MSVPERSQNKNKATQLLNAVLRAFVEAKRNRKMNIFCGTCTITAVYFPVYARNARYIMRKKLLKTKISSQS